MNRPEDAELERLLREGLRAPELPCAGFDSYVLASIRPRAGRSPYELPVALGWVSAAAGLGAALWAAAVWAGYGEVAHSNLSLLEGTMNGWLCWLDCLCLGSCLAGWWVTQAAGPIWGFKPRARRSLAAVSGASGPGDRRS